MKKALPILLVVSIVLSIFAVYSHSTVRAAGGLNLVVLCTSCAAGNIDSHGPVGTVVLDQNTGNVWHYPDDALFGKGEPRLLGKMNEVGRALIK